MAGVIKMFLFRNWRGQLFSVMSFLYILKYGEHIGHIVADKAMSL